MKDSFLFLGTGASAGIPVIGCKCPVCISKKEKNHRFRPSGLLNVGNKKLLIDIGPDFRSQALIFGVNDIDGLLLTHTHYDHIAGIDEVRVFNVRQKKALPCLLSKESFDEMNRRYHYFFDKEQKSAKCDFIMLPKNEGTIEFLGVDITYFSFTQGNMLVNGFRVKDFAYISDIQKYDPHIFDFLHGVKKLVISALRPEPSPFHLSFEQVLYFVNEIKAEETWITHLGHFYEHEELNSFLPQGVQVAYDGLKIEI